jgi:pimeloyl-ACP methyl ester carboxylesterase
MHNAGVIANQETVVLVHGLFMKGWSMALLRRRLRRCGFRVVLFSYPSLGNSVKRNAEHLQQFTRNIEADTVHFVGHSLGGLVILQHLQDFPAQQPGRRVLLGTPYAGSHVARRLAAHSVWRHMFGKSLDGGLMRGGPAWGGAHELGVIAGSQRIGAGLLIRDLPVPNDGTVAVAETRIPGMTEHITLPVSHTGLVLAASVAQQTCAFLKTGRFVRAPAALD